MLKTQKKKKKVNQEKPERLWISATNTTTPKYEKCLLFPKKKLKHGQYALH